MPTPALGGLDDQLTLQVDGRRISNATRYAFSRAILQQPSTFSFTIGSGDLAREIMSAIRPRQRVNLFLGNTKIFTGLVEDPTSSPSSGATEVTIEGRDMLAPLTKDHVLDEKAWGTPTYFDMTKEVMKIVGYQHTNLIAGNVANRNASSRVKAKLKGNQKAVEVVETNLSTPSGAKIEYQKVDCEIGQTWFDFLVAQYKRIGLYLWCGADGDLVLARPTAFMEPIYSIYRYRGQDRTTGNVVSHSFQNRTSARHAWCRVYGKGRPDKSGHIALYNEWNDFEMLAMGFTDCLVLHDNDCKTIQDCQYKAKRTLAEERRANRTLVYTVSGHTAPVLGSPSERAIWTPDTVVRVDDDEIAFPYLENYDNRLMDQGIHEDMYIEKVEFSRDNSGTVTKLHLMRQTDLMYLGEDTEVLGESEVKRESVARLVDPL